MDASLVRYHANRFFFALLCAGRASLSLGFLLHPIFAGLIWWLVTGDGNAIPPAVFFELIWLDLFYVGTYVPPNALLGYLVYYPLAFIFNMHIPQQSIFLLILCLPLPFLGAKVEIWYRMHQGIKAYAELWDSVDAEKNISGTLNRGVVHSIARWIIVSFFVYMCCLLVLFFVLWFLGDYLQAWPMGPYVQRHAGYDPNNLHAVINHWGTTWVLGGIGAMLSLRVRPATICFFAGALGVTVFML
jgi:PTS system mannose-specific IIC component